ncbi:hypothetical protein WSM22_17950 [Cytophagales bacterium WSM2-2]|nr:hypothetical protein WSM22_17950 [Cytophagales bacterium WSM2-2]
MKFRDLVIQNILIIAFGVIIFYLDFIEFKDSNTKVLVVVFSIIKSSLFVWTGFRKIVFFSKMNISYYNFLAFIGISISLIVVSFAVDYLCLFQIDEASFTGISESLTWYERCFKFYFFSVLVFSNVGIATVVPNTIASEFLMMVEAILSFITIILVLSDFISLKESISGRRKKPEA